MTRKFVHLHCHSTGSLLDGMSRTGDMAKRTSEIGMPAIALTDHGVLYSGPQFAEECEKVGVHPVIGVELYLAPGHRSLRQEIDGERYFHLLALAENESGYKNLCRLVSRSYTEGFYAKPRTDLELLAEHREGLIVTSACLGGPLAARIMKDRIPKAKHAAEELKDIFGTDNFFVELQDHGLERQHLVNAELSRIADQCNLSTIASNDTHYTMKRDAEPHEVLLCVQTGKTWTDPKRLRYGDAQWYIKSPEEMAETSLTAYPGCLERTVEIAARCQFKFPKGQMHVPNFEVPEGHTPESWLEKLCRDAIPAQYPAHDERLEQRLTYELGLIQRKGYSTYFLIVHDIVSYAQGAGIMSQARGSAAGSVVSYLLGLSVVDPLRYNLLFDRFLNENRKSLPDIDIDFADRRREEVFQYCRTKYGEENVARIVAFSTMAARAAIKDAGRVLEYSGQEVGAITRLISPKPNTTIAGSIESTSELREAYEADPKVKRLIDTAKGLEGLHRQASVHAAGLVITPEPVSNFAPVQVMNDGAAIQYDMEYAEKIGLLKIDCLALRNLTVANDCLRFIEEKEHRKLTLPELPHDDAETYALLQRGETTGVFQFGDTGITRVVRGIHPERLEDLIAAVALYRPGPLESGMVKSYIDRKHGREKVTYEHELLEPILRDTYGMIVYQEQVMQITMALAGFTPGGAEAAMKGMGKKKKEVIEALEKDFREGCAKNQIPAELASRIFTVMVNFSGYAFNMCLSGKTVLHRTAANHHQPPTISIEDLYNGWHSKTPWGKKLRRIGVTLLQRDPDGRVRPGLCKGVYQKGVQNVWRVTTASGRFIDATANHRMLTEIGYRRVDELLIGDCLIACGEYEETVRVKTGQFYRKGCVPFRRGSGNTAFVDGRQAALDNAQDQVKARSGSRCEDCGKPAEGGKHDIEFAHIKSLADCGGDYSVYHSAGNIKHMCNSCHKKFDYAKGERKKRNTKGRPTFADRIVSIENLGAEMTYDVEMDTEEHNFVANGLISHNSHSAAYALLGYHTAYLKCHYPVEFMAASISSLSDKRDKLTQYALEARRMAVTILAPSVQYSVENCYPEAGAIYLGLKTIKGVNDACASAIVAARRGRGLFGSLGDFAARVGHTEPISKAACEAMVRAGALDAFGDRAGLLAASERLASQMSGLAKGSAPGQSSLFSGEATITTAIEVPVVPPLPETERLAGEREVLGLYLSKHPVLKAEETLRKAGCTFAADLGECEPDSRVTVGGMVQKVTDKRTRNGQPLSVVELDDPTGTVSVIIFVQIHAQVRPLCEPGKLVVVNGTVSVKEGEEGAAEIDIKANEVREMEMPKETGPGSLVLRFDDAVPPGVLSSLRGAFGSGLSGGCRVILEIGAVQIATEVRVDPDSLFAKRAVHLVGREGGTAEFV